MPVEEFTARMEKLVNSSRRQPRRRAMTKCWWRAIRSGAPRPSGASTAFSRGGNWEGLCKAAARVKVAAPAV